MITKLTHVSLVVRDIDEALKFYRDIIGFEVRDDNMWEDFRWTTVGPKTQPDLQIVLYKPHPKYATPEEFEIYNSQIGKTPCWAYSTDNCAETIKELKAKGVTILQEATTKPWGIEGLAADLYGNKMCIVEAK